MRIVTRRTGLTAELLRAWERRHEVVRPARSAGGRRLYSDADIERLRLLYQATLAGRRIGDVAALSTDALAELVRHDLAATAEVARGLQSGERAADASLAPSARYEDCLRALEQLDLAMLSSVLWSAAVALPAVELFDAVVLPLLGGAGMVTSAATLRPLHRRLATIGARRLLEAIIERAGQSVAMGTVVVAAPAGQADELGAMVIGALAASDEWRVMYLGADVLAEDIAEAAGHTRARAVLLSVGHHADTAMLRDIRHLRRALPSDVALIVGGGASIAHRAVLDQIGVLRFADLDACRAQLSALRRARRHRRDHMRAAAAAGPNRIR